MRKKHKILLEFVKKEETEFGAIGLKESVDFTNAISKVGKKFKFDCYFKGYPKEKLDYKPTNKKYHIETLEDIAKLSEEQFEFFIDDLRSWVNIQRSVVQMNDTLGNIIGTKKGMIWLDTGLNESKINIEISNKSNQK